MNAPRRNLYVIEIPLLVSVTRTRSEVNERYYKKRSQKKAIIAPLESWVQSFFDL